MPTSHSTIVVAHSQISSDLSNAKVILNLDSGIYYGLDEVGARIWNLIQQPRTVGDILDVLVAEYVVEPERAEADLNSLLQKLNDAKLIEIKNADS